VIVTTAMATIANVPASPLQFKGMVILLANKRREFGRQFLHERCNATDDSRQRESPEDTAG